MEVGMGTGRVVAVALATVVVAGSVATPGTARSYSEPSGSAAHRTYTERGHIEIGHQGWPCFGLAQSCGGVTEGRFRSTCRIDREFPNGTQGLDGYVFRIPKGLVAPGSKLTVRGVATIGIADVSVFFFGAVPWYGAVDTAPCRIIGWSFEAGDEIGVAIPLGTRWVSVGGGQFHRNGYDIDVTLKLTTPSRRAHKSGAEMRPARWK
ncbi:MAG: hypothetical protein ABR575_02460 [Actinomycetota bacterium]